MFKKSIIMLVVIAVVATFSMIPVAALDDSSLFFSVDFDTESVEDSTGNFAYEDLESVMDSTDLTYEADEEIGRNVLVLEGDGVLTWRHPDGEAASLNGLDLSVDGLTVEAYVWISDDGGETNMVIIETNDSAVHLQEYNDGTDLCAGFRAGDGISTQVAQSNAYINGTFPHGEWVHIVGTADGDSNDLYINGAHKATFARSSNILSNMHGSRGEAIVMGESYLGDMWGATAFWGKIAYARIYKATATEAEVATMYTEATGNDPDESGPVVEATPVPPPPVEEPPVEEPPVEDGSSESDDVVATPKPTQAPVQNNTQTFDLGLVSLAAVALSSAVVIKKRK